MNSTLVNNPCEVYGMALSSCAKKNASGSKISGLTEVEKVEMEDVQKLKGIIDLALSYEKMEFVDPVTGELSRVFHELKFNWRGLSWKDQFASIFLGDRSQVKRAFYYHCLAHVEKFIDNNSHSNIAGDVMEMVEGIQGLGRKSRARLKMLALRHLDYVLFHSKITMRFMDLKENRPEDAAKIDNFLQSDFFKNKYERHDILLGFTPMGKVSLEDVLADFETPKF